MITKHKKIFTLILIGLYFVSSFVAWGSEVHQELQETVRAEVLEIVSREDKDIMGTGVTTTVETVRVEILQGQKSGEVASFENDLLALNKGDKIYVNRLVAIDGTEYYTFKDIDRKLTLMWLSLALVVLVIVFASWQGVRAIFSLLLSMLAIWYLLVPALLAGYNPALASFILAAVILAFTLFVTHGLRPYVFLAYLGTMSAVGISCLVTAFSVSALRLTGFSADASVYLNFATGGQLDLAGLLLGGIIIGLLGVLDDVAITQASVVQELKAANSHLTMRELYQSSIRVGRDHVGSLVNTLALAYVGTSLPLVLLYAKSAAPLLDVVNQEMVAGELLRIMVGSMGLVLAVPLTSMLAAGYFARRSIDISSSTSHTHHHHH